MAISQPLTSKHYSPGEAAALLGVSVRTIRRHIKAGSLMASRIGRLLRISEASLRTFLAENRVAP